MSITIDWPTLTTGPSGLALADSIRDFIHDKFQQVTLPRFIRSVHVHSFEFGDECPVVELKDISDPLPEFYENNDDNDGGDEDESSEGEAFSGAIEAPTAAPKQEPSQPSYRPSTLSTTTKTPTIDTRLQNLNLRPGLPFPTQHDQITTPFLSRSSTPGLPTPGGTSNFSYFHLPLSAGLSGTQTPLPWGDYHHHHHQPQSPSPVERERVPFSHFTHTASGPTTTGSDSYHRSSHHPDPARKPAAQNGSGLLLHPPPPQQQQQQPDDRSQDLQTTLHISYSGSLSLSLTAEILLDYPMPSFVGIPLKLQITGLSFDGVALLAYLRHHRPPPHHPPTPPDGAAASADAEGETERRKVHFCFLGREDARAMVGDEGGGKEEREEEKKEEEGLGGLLREIRVESEIGRQEGGKQVLKNVGKVEKFVLEQVRRIFEDEFVWPSFWTFLV